MNYEAVVNRMDAEERIEEARLCIRALTDEAVKIVDLHAHCEYLLDKELFHPLQLDGRANDGFCAVKGAVINYRTIKLIGVWDKADKNTISIRKVKLLLQSDEVYCRLVAMNHEEAKVSSCSRNYSEDSNRSHEEIEKTIMAIHYASAKKRANKGIKDLRRKINGLDAKIESNLEKVKNLRDSLSHPLTETNTDLRRINRGGKPLKRPTEKEITNLKNSTIKIIQDMYCWINGTDFDISGQYSRQADECADAFWSSFAPS